MEARVPPVSTNTETFPTMALMLSLAPTLRELYGVRKELQLLLLPWVWGAEGITSCSSTELPWSCSKQAKIGLGRALKHLHPSCQAWTPPTPLASSQSAATTAHAATRRCSSSRKSRLSSSGATRRHLPTAPARLCGEYPQPPTQPSSLASLSSPSLAYLPYLLFCLQGSPRTSYLQRVPMGEGALPWLFTCTSLLTASSLIAPKAPVSAARQKNRKEARGFRGC